MEMKGEKRDSEGKGDFGIKQKGGLGGWRPRPSFSKNIFKTNRTDRRPHWRMGKWGSLSRVDAENNRRPGKGGKKAGKRGGKAKRGGAT